MVNASNPGLIMWLLLIVPFKAPCWPDCPAIYFDLSYNIALRGFLRLLVQCYICSLISQSCWDARGSPNSGILRLVTLVAVQTLLAIASATELIQTPWLGDLKAYHDIVFYTFKVGCLIMVSCRLVLGVFIQVPGPFPAKLTFLWQGWHLLRHTYDQAVLQAHQTYGAVTVRTWVPSCMLTLVPGTIVRLSPFTHSAAKDQCSLELQQLLHPRSSHPCLALAQIFKDSYQCSTLSDRLMGEALSNEFIIDSCTDGLLHEFARSIDEKGSHRSKLLTCLCWEIIGATTIGYRFRFLNSAEAQLLAKRIADFRIRSLRKGSFDCFYPWIAKIAARFASSDPLADCFSLFEETVIQGCSSEATEEHLGAIWKSLCTKFGIGVYTINHYSGIMSALIGTGVAIAAHLRTVMFYVASCPEAQSRIRGEMQSRSVGETLTLENLLQLASQFPYLDAVLRESDRLMASDDITLDYFAKEPVTIDGCRIPSDSTIRLSKLAAGLDKSLFGEDAHEWNPTRWLDGNNAMALKSSFNPSPPYANPTSRAIVAKIILRLVQQFQFTTDMSSAAPTIIFLSAEDLDQLRVCIKSRALQEKLSAVNNPHGATLMTVSLNPTQRLLSMFEGDAKEKLSLYIKDPTQCVKFGQIQSVTLKRDERREVHNLIRQLSKGKLDSGLDNETSRINVFVRSSTTQYHKQENQRPRLPRQQNTQQQRAPVRASPYHNANNNRNTASRNKLANRGVAPRASPTVPLAVTAQPTTQNKGTAAKARAERRAAPIPETEHTELRGAHIEQTYTFTGKEQEPELSPEEIAERAERRKNVIPPHMRRTVSQSKKDE